MIKRITIYLVISLLTFNLMAQFDPAAARSSLVRVVISVNRNESNVQTGFVWKSPDQIVTSMHGMSRTGTIRVLYAGNAWREARIKKVLQKADLVLLDLVPGQPLPPAEVRPIMSFSSDPIRHGTEVYAIGYNSGAIGSSSRTLKKDDAEPPETLARLIPPKDKDILSRVGFPDINIPIIYLEGSLLPGFSGAPVFNANNRLIGIGNGGLEKGASNVSWLIPAKYLTELENSNVTTLPAHFEQVAQLFSARVTIDSPIGEPQAFEKQITQSNFSKSFTASGFEFYLTKNRSLIEMVETSEDPDNMLMFAEELSDFNIAIDYEKMRFDIYEDIMNGVILAIPEGHDLFYDAEGGYFAVRYNESSLVGLMYYGNLDDYSYTDFHSLTGEVQDWVNTYLPYIYGVSGFETDEDYSYWNEYSGGRKIAWISMMSNDPVWAMDGNAYMVGLYITLLMTDEKSLMALSSYLIPLSLLEYTAVYGIDCVNPVFLEQCQYFESLVKVFCAAHLTTFAY